MLIFIRKWVLCRLLICLKMKRILIVYVFVVLSRKYWILLIVLMRQFKKELNMLLLML